VIPFAIVIAFWICSAWLIVAAFRRFWRRQHPPVLSEEEAVRSLYGGRRERTTDKALSNHDGHEVLR
jgi:hypothetical protein